jgi:hypothetical protein
MAKAKKVATVVSHDALGVEFLYPPVGGVFIGDILRDVGGAMIIDRYGSVITTSDAAVVETAALVDVNGSTITDSLGSVILTSIKKTVSGKAQASGISTTAIRGAAADTSVVSGVARAAGGSTTTIQGQAVSTAPGSYEIVADSVNSPLVDSTGSTILALIPLGSYDAITDSTGSPLVDSSGSSIRALESVTPGTGDLKDSTGSAILDSLGSPLLAANGDYAETLADSAGSAITDSLGSSVTTLI